MNWEKILNRENFSEEKVGKLASEWGEVNFRQIDDVILKPFREIIAFPTDRPFVVLQTHVARTESDQGGIEKLGGVLGAIEPRLEYGIDAVNEVKIALGITKPTSRYYAEPRSGRTNVYLTPFAEPTNSHDQLSRPTGKLETDPGRVLKLLGPTHQIIREDMISGDATDAVNRLKQLSNKWRIAVI